MFPTVPTAYADDPRAVVLMNPDLDDDDRVDQDDVDHVDHDDGECDHLGLVPTPGGAVNDYSPSDTWSCYSPPTGYSIPVAVPDSPGRPRNVTVLVTEGRARTERNWREHFNRLNRDSLRTIAEELAFEEHALTSREYASAFAAAHAVFVAYKRVAQFLRKHPKECRCPYCVHATAVDRREGYAGRTRNHLSMVLAVLREANVVLTDSTGDLPKYRRRPAEACCGEAVRLRPTEGGGTVVTVRIPPPPPVPAGYSFREYDGDPLASAVRDWVREEGVTTGNPYLVACNDPEPGDRPDADPRSVVTTDFDFESGTWTPWR